MVNRHKQVTLLNGAVFKNMKTKIVLNEKEISLVEKAEARENFGTWFSEDGTPDYFIKRCEEQISNCRKWIANLEVLKKQKLIEKAEAHKDELKALLESMTPEEKQYS